MDLLPCPNPHCPYRDGHPIVDGPRETASHFGAIQFVECKCGTRGPKVEMTGEEGTKKAAEAWNALPRGGGDGWTTFKRDDADTWPPTYTVFLIQYRSGQKGLGWYDDEDNRLTMTDGDQWMVWPGEMGR